MNPMIRFRIAQISDPMNPCSKWIRQITDLKMDLLKGTRRNRNPDPDPPKETPPKKWSFLI